MFQHHSIYNRLKNLEKKVTFPASEEVRTTLEEIDKLMVQLMLQSERKCRKICAAHYEFSPVIKDWLDRCHAFCQLICMKIGKPMGNLKNVKRFKKRFGLEKEIAFTAKELHTGYKACQK